MGNTSSSASLTNSSRERTSTSRVLFYLHRTWAIIVTEKWMTSTRNNNNINTQNNGKHLCSDSTLSDLDSQYSQYSFCSCSQCQRDDGFSSGCDSELFGSGSSMAPNSEESSRLGQLLPFPPEDGTTKEKQRPPIYNPEDYAISLKKWGRKSTNGNNSISLYPIMAQSASATSNELDCTASRSPNHHHSFRDYRNPMLISSGSEMTLRQFGTVTELLAKLKSDLRLAYPSFIQEFVGEPLDGVTLLLDLLRGIQLSQSNNSHQQTSPGSNNTTGKIPPSLQRRALLDELSCLQCLLHCCQRYSESVRKLTVSSAGLFTLAICIMSNVTKSRVLALQLLTRACQPSANGHSAVSEALSTLRLRFGEPVRFRFLIGMLMSAGGQGELLAVGMKFLNTFLDSAGSMQKRLYIQAELEQAGFDVAAIKKNISINSSTTEQIFEELDHWEKKHMDVESIMIRLESSERENDSLRDKVLLLERRVQILLEEKGILISLEQCLKERCSELQEEVHSLKSEKSQKNSTCGSSTKKKDSHQEDEGISSSDRSLTPEEDMQRESSVYEIFSSNIKPSQDLHHDNVDDDEEETTIDEVIEELRNIINDAETETYQNEAKKKQMLQAKDLEQNELASKIQMRVDVDDFSDECEIIPSNLHPQPPRRTRSLVHLFIPAEDYDYGNKELFFENETAYTSEEGSDSLLSASKYQLPRLDKDLSSSTRKKSSIKRSESFRHLAKPPQPNLPRDNLSKQNSFDGGYYSNGPVVVVSCNNQEDYKKKSKSLDRIADDGLDSMVDIVLTGKREDSEDLQSLSRSISQVFHCHNKRINVEDKLKMFLPAKRDHSDIPYYFPRIQEKKSNSFLIKRGHANAGLYSGHQVIRDKIVGSATKSNNDFMQNNNNSSSRIGEKVTDLPSGLY